MYSQACSVLFNTHHVYPRLLAVMLGIIHCLVCFTGMSVCFSQLILCFCHVFAGMPQYCSVFTIYARYSHVSAMYLKACLSVVQYLQFMPDICRYCSIFFMPCICRHAQDVREHYEKKLERANNLYMELTACMLQLEKRERELLK